MWAMGNLFLAELSRTWTLFRRYPIPNVAYATITFILFYGLFLGGKYLAGPAALMGSRLDALVVGYIVWTMSLSALADISIGLQDDMQTGTLEHIYLSPYGPTRIYLMRGMARLLINVTITLMVTFLIMFSMGHWLQWRVLALPAALVVLVSAYGFSMFFGGLTLLVKRLGGLLGLVQFMLLYLVLMPLEDKPLVVQVLSGLMPIAPTVALLRQVLSETGEVQSFNVGLAVGNAVLYMVAGLLLFRKADRVMRLRGSINQF
jgi:ABC-2 type transport system permease protein